MKNGIGTNGNGKHPIRVAIEDSVVIFIYTFATAVLVLSQTGTPVDNVGAYVVPALLALVAGVLSWSKARDINLGGGRNGP